jgi:hypothetical protein
VCADSNFQRRRTYVAEDRITRVGSAATKSWGVKAVINVLVVFQAYYADIALGSTKRAFLVERRSHHANPTLGKKRAA